MKNDSRPKLEIEEIGNNRYVINGQVFYAPNVQSAINKYEIMIKRNGER